MTAPELSRPIRLDTIGDVPRDVDVEADAAERAALARRFGLVRLDRLAATVVLTREAETVRASGRLEAALAQACVAGGGDVPQAIDEAFDLRFVPEGPAAADEVELDAGELDTVAYAGGAIDVGEAVAQTLGLSIDPFPRGPEADATLRAAGVLREGEARAGPFAKLLDLKGRLES